MSRAHRVGRLLRQSAAGAACRIVAGEDLRRHNGPQVQCTWHRSSQAGSCLRRPASGAHHPGRPTRQHTHTHFDGAVIQPRSLRCGLEALGTVAQSATQISGASDGLLPQPVWYMGRRVCALLGRVCGKSWERGNSGRCFGSPERQLGILQYTSALRHVLLGSLQGGPCQASALVRAQATRCVYVHVLRMRTCRAGWPRTCIKRSCACREGHSIQMAASRGWQRKAYEGCLSSQWGRAGCSSGSFSRRVPHALPGRP